MTEIMNADGGDLNSSIDMTMSMNDVIAIVTSRAETQLNATIKERTAAAKKKTADAEGIKKATAKQNEAEVLAKVTDRVTALRPAIEAFGGTVKVEVSSSSSGGYNGQATTFYSTATVTVVPNGKESGSYTASFVTKLEYDTEKVAKVAKADSLLADARHDQEVAVDARRKVANLSTIERQTRAMLAEKHLKGVKGGDELIALLTGDMEKKIAAIGGV